MATTQYWAVTDECGIRGARTASIRGAAHHIVQSTAAVMTTPSTSTHTHNRTTRSRTRASPTAPIILALVYRTIHLSCSSSSRLAPTSRLVTMSLSEPLSGSRGANVDETADYLSLENGHKPASGSSAVIDALWGSNARKIVTIATAAIITILLGIILYTAMHEKEEFVPVYDSSTGGGGGSYVPPSTAAPYIPAETEMLRRLAYEMDMSRDLSADPCEDWYQYSCGGWVKATELQPNQTMNTKGFTEARDDNQRYIAEILNADWPIITPMFQSCMDVERVNREGLEPVRRLMSVLSPNSTVIRTPADLFFALGELRYAMRLNALLIATQTANLTNPRQPLLQLTFGGFTIAGNNAWMSYLGPNATHIIPRMVEGISAMFQVIDGDESKERSDYYAHRIVEFERSLINITSRTAIADYYRRRPSLQEKIDQTLAEEHALGAENGMFSWEEVGSLAPHVHFQHFFNGSMLLQHLMAGNITTAYLPDNASFPLVNELVANTPLDVLLAYSRWRALNHSMPYLAYEVRALHHSYFHELAPTTSYDDTTWSLALPNNYAYCSQLVVYNLDDLFGRYFVSLRLPPEKAEVARNLITWIRQAFERNLPSISWMDQKTRDVALDKANAVLELVGGPQDGNWADYSRVTITRDQFYYNWLQVQAMRAEDEWRQLTKPISRAKFTMNPSLVNAQYSSRANAMTFPAAILQEVSNTHTHTTYQTAMETPSLNYHYSVLTRVFFVILLFGVRCLFVQPFFDFDYPMAVNLGRIGMVMGHELLHGFDNNGRQFDKDGVRRQWWDDTVVANFVTKSQCIIKQYDNINVQGSMVNGTFTLGENIADNGGLHMAWLALQWYKESLWTNRTEYDPVPQTSKKPLTTDQLFYWANAQTWCTKATDAAIANQIRTDVHSPGEARVWGPIVNQPDNSFAKAFECKVGSRMNPAPADKCDLY